MKFTRKYSVERTGCCCNPDRAEEAEGEYEKVEFREATEEIGVEKERTASRVEQRLQGKVEGEREGGRLFNKNLRTCWWERIGIFGIGFQIDDARDEDFSRIFQKRGQEGG